jgi:exonuclease III
MAASSLDLRPSSQRLDGGTFSCAFKPNKGYNWMDCKDDDQCMIKGNEWKKENILKFATWNVQGIAHKEEQLDDILAKKGISVAVISETKKKLQGTRETRNFLQFYCGVEREVWARAGIMLMIHKCLKSAINDYTFWNERIIQMRLKRSRGYLSIIGVYASVEGEEEESDKFYQKLQTILNKINKNDTVMLMGDFNARVGNSKIEQCIGTFGEQTCNRNGIKLIDFVVCNQLKIMNTMFDHKDSHKFTWEAINLQSIIYNRLYNMQ